MIKLLNAGFTRLRKSKLLYSLIIFSIGIALSIIFNQYGDMNKYGYKIEVENLILNYYPTMIGIITAIFTSLFLGAEYSDGAIRNKIIIGHKRINIYLSNLIITIITCLSMYTLFITIVMIIGIPLFGNITMPISQLLMMLVCIFLATIAYASIFTFIAMMISNKTIIAIISIMLSFGLIMAAITCFNILNTPETIASANFVNGETMIEEIPNPKYPSETKKKVCQVLLDANPAGQTFELAGGAPDLKVLALYSLGIIILFTSTGLVLFNKKELK